MKKAIFLDRDGVINCKAPEGQYITNVDAFEMFPGVVQAVRDLNDADYYVFVVTNQRALRTGKLTVWALQAIHRSMLDLFLQGNAHITSIYFCPHDYPDHCQCRKPKPGMLLQAAAEHGLNLEDSWMIGDTDSDIQAGKTAGCLTARITNRGILENETIPDLIAADLPEAVIRILAYTKG